jgi:myo-inositol-1(or 4)-monophosphatase
MQKGETLGATMDRTLFNQIEADIARAAGALMEKWPGNAESGELQQETKADGSLVTEADFASNEILVSSIQTLFPQDAILSEELPVPENIDQEERIWIIDPLDGTKHFAHGRDDFSVLVALREGDSIEYGVMHFPAQDRVAVGWRGKESLVNSSPVTPSTSELLSDAKVYIRNFTAAEEDARFDLGRPMDSGMALLSVADGTLDGLIIKMTTHKVWDIAAPVVVLEGAGAKVTDEKGKPLEFRSGEINFDYFVASNGRVHDQLLEIIRRSEQ